jgi:hypothetical protein
MESDGKGYSLWKYELAYFLTICFFVSGLVFLFVHFVDWFVWVEVSVSVVLVILFLWFFLETSELFLDSVLSEKQKEEAGFYVVRWKSKEFDSFVGSELIDLYLDNCRVFGLFETDPIRANNSYVSDYSFLLLPIAKVYEGVLKKILVEKGVIDESVLLENPSVNVSSYLNPVGNKNISNLLKDKARDKAIPHVIYSTYQECRNQILHYDQHRDSRIKSFDDAKFYQRRILDAIDKAYQTFR